MLEEVVPNLSPQQRLIVVPEGMLDESEMAEMGFGVLTPAVRDPLAVQFQDLTVGTVVRVSLRSQEVRRFLLLLSYSSLFLFLFLFFSFSATFLLLHLLFLLHLFLSFFVAIAVLPSL